MQPPTRRLFLALLSVLIAALLIYLFLPRNRGPYRALPSQSALVVEFGGLLRAKKMLDDTRDPSWRSTLNSPIFQQPFRDAEPALRLFRHQPDMVKALAQNKTLAAFTLHPSDSLHPLFIVEISSGFNLEKALKTNEMTQKYFPHQFHGNTIFNIHLSKTEQLEVAAAGNLLLFSRKATLVEDALAQLERTRNWWSDRPHLDELPEAPLRVHLRPAALAEQWRNRMLPRWRGLPDLLARNVEWAGISYDSSQCRILTETRGFLNGLARWGGPLDTAIFNILPDNTAFLARAGLGNVPDFFRHLGELRSGDFEQFVLPWVGKEAVFALTEPVSPALSGDRLLILAVSDTALARRSFETLGKSRGVLPGITGAYQMFDIWGFQDAGFLHPLLGNDDAFRNPVACLLENFVLFAPDRSSMELVLDKYLVGQTLANNADCLQLLQKIKQNDNAQFFINTAFQSGLLKNLFQDEPELPSDTVGRLLVASIQPRLAAATEISMAEQALSGAPVQTDILWKMPLSSLIAGPPVVIQTAGGNHFVLLQDAQNRLYCLDAQNGSLVWSKALSERILSEIEGIDFYGNGSKCFTFNTATQIFTLDEAGRDVQGFPLILPARATNGMLVVDFDKNTKFSYFVACENGNLYGLGHLGKTLDGWNARPISGPVRQPMLHFQHKGKDYLVLLSENGLLSVFGRDGSLRFPTLQWEGVFNTRAIADPVPRIYAANTAGQLFSCDLQGNTNVVQAGKPNGSAAFGQLAGDARFEWAYLEGKSTRVGAWDNSGGKSLFSIDFREKQHRIFFCPDHRIGTVDLRGRRIWLFDQQGNPRPGFPLGGNTAFVLYTVNGVEILVTGNGNAVWAYLVR
ncbi:MAG: DUF3352 domain-containing protein [Saprospiraceae bacterium]|nr:DUF3352 domain-containing protein [Saprospiraceae bacterium]